MKTTKRLVSFVLCLMMIAALSAPAFAAAPGGTAQLNSSVPLAGEDYISCYSTNGIYYYVSPKSTTYYVGYGYTNARKTVRLCQAFCQAVGHRPAGGVDGYFGSNTEQAIRAAQGTVGTAVDGYCGFSTWKEMYFYVGCAAGSQGVVGDSGVVYAVRNYLGVGENMSP